MSVSGVGAGAREREGVKTPGFEDLLVVYQNERTGLARV